MSSKNKLKIKSHYQYLTYHFTTTASLFINEKDHFLKRLYSSIFGFEKVKNVDKNR